MGEGGGSGGATTDTTITDFIGQLTDKIEAWIPDIIAGILAVLVALLAIYGVKFAWRWIKGLLGR